MGLIAIPLHFAVGVTLVNTAAAGELDPVAPSRCQAQYNYNAQAVFKPVWDKIFRLDELVRDLQAIKQELTGQETWYGGDPTGETALLVAQLAQALKTTANLKRDLLSVFAGHNTCATQATLSVGEKILVGEGRNEDLAAEIGKCIWEVNPALDKTYGLLRSIENLYNNMQKFVEIERDHRALRAEVAQRVSQLDRQIAKHERVLSSAWTKANALERELRQAAQDYCAAGEKAEAERERQEAERMMELMEQTRAGLGQLGKRHQQELMEVEHARQHRDDALSQSMQRHLQRTMQQQQIIQQQQSAVGTASGRARCRYVGPPECATRATDGRCLPKIREIRCDYDQ